MENGLRQGGNESRETVQRRSSEPGKGRVELERSGLIDAAHVWREESIEVINGFGSRD